MTGRQAGKKVGGHNGLICARQQMGVHVWRGRSRLRRCSAAAAERCRAISSAS